MKGYREILGLYKLSGELHGDFRGFIGISGGFEGVFGDLVGRQMNFMGVVRGFGSVRWFRRGSCLFLSSLQGFQERGV